MTPTQPPADQIERAMKLAEELALVTGESWGGGDNGFREDARNHLRTYLESIIPERAEPSSDKLIEDAIERATGKHRVLCAYDYEDVFSSVEKALALYTSSIPPPANPVAAAQVGPTS